MNKGIQNIFSPIPQTYELINHILTLGFDTPIRRYTAKLAAYTECHPEFISGSRKEMPKRACPEEILKQVQNDTFRVRHDHFVLSDNINKKWLDVCTGTGEMAHYLSKYAGADTLVMASDFTLPMLRYARQRRNSQVRFTAADSLKLPFKNNTFDLVTISFATRNINTSRANLISCLKEFHRVLKPGGRFINLETSQPSSITWRKLLHEFARTFVRPIGSALSGSPSAYAYLSQTIPRFYDADRFSEIILEAGFGECKYKRLMGGLAAIHQGTKKQ